MLDFLYNEKVAHLKAQYNTTKLCVLFSVVGSDTDHQLRQDDALLSIEG